jgi:hypothetical protein
MFISREGAAFAGTTVKPNFRSLDLKMADYQRLAGHFQI